MKQLIPLVFCICLYAIPLQSQIAFQQEKLPDFDRTMFKHFKEPKKSYLQKGILVGMLAGLAVAGTTYFIAEVYVPKLTDTHSTNTSQKALTYGISGIIIGGFIGAIVSISIKNAATNH
ncbi:MAG TPA: hypothetical protein VFI33_17980 [Puia sp.]|nr:hypothetical protein [Puia sp.]